MNFNHNYAINLKMILMSHFIGVSPIKKMKKIEIIDAVNGAISSLLDLCVLDDIQNC